MAGRIKNHYHDEIVRQGEIRRNNERCHPLSPDYRDPELDAATDGGIEPFIDITESVPAPADLNGWKARIGDYVKFVDEEAVVEAIIAETQYPILYIGKLVDAYVIKIYQEEILYASVKPMWDAPIKCIPCSSVRFAD